VEVMSAEVVAAEAAISETVLVLCRCLKSDPVTLATAIDGVIVAARAAERAKLAAFADKAGLHVFAAAIRKGEGL
jgi:hypothetical protein